ncbi:MAG TPA: 4-hydroxythreonine-4-phosphate dehydrogenase PdxA [Thermodesulfobacteriota bacterium]|nr:4-hydroxythreonine-4-phosphate dehydrogenase PdxA [Thermodesulfobacteriota bacterium]
MRSARPRVGVVLGDPAGIGPEVAVKVLASGEPFDAELVVVGDPRHLRRGEQIAGVRVPAELPVETVEGPGPDEIALGALSELGGRVALAALSRALDLAREGRLDAVVFAPLNKAALRRAGSRFADEHQFFADYLGHTGVFGELNVLDRLWTSRVTSHVPLRAVAGLITEARVVDAIRLADASLRQAGIEAPRLGVAALNPHAGENGMFGDEEIRILAPAIARAREEGIDAEGPVSADVIFVRARAGRYDAVVTMYHDQGQVAMKLMGFERGVTVSGGLPIPITTPAHGTAFDIAGKGVANPGAFREALRLAVRMARRGRPAPPRA